MDFDLKKQYSDKIINNNYKLDPNIWGPHYWFVLHTIAISYPTKPNDFIKKKFYELIQNIALFVPDEKIGNDFLDLIDKYPVTPYLDSRMSLMKWTNFIHNKINEKLGKPYMNFYDSLDAYYTNYKPREIVDRVMIKKKHLLLYGAVIVALIGGSYYLYFE